MGYSLATCELIVAINEATPVEIRELMKITHPDGSVSDLRHQLMCAYGCLQPFVKKHCVKVFVSQIWSRNALNIEKIKQEKEFIEILKNPESYWKESTQKTDSDKESAIVGVIDSTAQDTTFNQTKSRAGGSQSYQERDIEREWDKSDEDSLKTVSGQSLRNPEATRLEITQEEGQPWKIGKAQPGEAKEIPAIKLQNAEEVEELPLDSITLSSTRAIAEGIRNSATNTGKDIRSRKGSLQHTKSFIKARAIKELQQLQSIDWRAKIIQEFACLFKGAFGHDLCL